MNFVAGDVAQAAAILWRNHGDAKVLTPNSETPDNWGGTAITLNYSQVFDGPTRIQAIQSLASENQPNGELDMVMLVRLPLMDKDGVAIADPPGGTDTGSRLALIRNSKFQEKPSGVTNGYEGWKIELDELPLDTRRCWISGGHKAPRYYFYSGAANTTCPNGLETRRFSAATGLLEWRCLARDLLEVREPKTGSNPNGDPNNDLVGQHGPIFVNPFNPNILIVASTSPSRWHTQVVDRCRRQFL